MINHILLGFGVSFVGSIPLGVLNLTAIEVAVARRFYQVLLFALGVIIVEYGQAFIAIQFSSIMLSNPSIEYAIEVAVIPLFLVAGGFYLYSSYQERKERKKQQDEPRKEERKVAPFYKGIMLSIINPLAIPYWLAVSTSLKAAGQLRYESLYIHSFIIGIVLGTFACLTLYGSVGEVLEDRLKKYEKYFNTIIGLILISLAIMQIYRVFLS